MESTEIEITFKLKSRWERAPMQPQMFARGLIEDMREAIIQSEHNKSGSQHEWHFDIVGEGFKITEVEE